MSKNLSLLLVWSILQTIQPVSVNTLHFIASLPFVIAAQVTLEGTTEFIL